MAPLLLVAQQKRDQQSSNTALPGMKRGIAIGVAASVCIILIALLTYFAIKRRKILKKRAQPPLSEPKFEETWPEDKPVQTQTKLWNPLPALPPPPPVEADAKVIYEMDAGHDAGQIPELPTKLYIKDAQELEASGKRHSDDFMKWNDASEVPFESPVLGVRGPLPILRISPPEPSPLENTSPLAVSPVAISPLDEVYLPGQTRSVQGWI